MVLVRVWVLGRQRVLILIPLTNLTLMTRRRSKEVNVKRVKKVRARQGQQQKKKERKKTASAYYPETSLDVPPWTAVAGTDHAVGHAVEQIARVGVGVGVGVDRIAYSVLNLGLTSVSDSDLVGWGWGGGAGRVVRV